MDGAQEATLEQGGSDTNDEGLGIDMAKHGRRSNSQQVWTHWAMVIPKDSVPWYFGDQLQWLYGLSQDC
jgi:hypothetical protein